MTASTAVDDTTDQDRTPIQEMLRLADQYPMHTLQEVIDLIDRDIWHIEEPTNEQHALYSKINGRTALQKMQEDIDTFQAEFPLNAPARTPQWLASGLHICAPKVLDGQTLQQLIAHCDDLLHVQGTRPIEVFENPNILSKSDVMAITKAALNALPTALPEGSTPAILKKRTLLRRTFSPSQRPIQVGNANNQHWHQDSNPNFNDTPMLTLWIPLQNGSGETCPGIQIIDAPVSFFSVIHGDSSRGIHPILVDMFSDTKVVSIIASAGDCIVFNGLTFHQTSTLPTMTHHRDALLIRVIDAKAAGLFGVNDPEQGLVPLV